MQLALRIRHVGLDARDAVALIDFKPHYLVRRFLRAQRLKDELADFNLVEFTTDFTVLAPTAGNDFFAPLLTGGVNYLLIKDFHAGGAEVLASEAGRVVFGHGEVWWSCFLAGTDDLYETLLLREETVLDLIIKEEAKEYHE